jgi:centromere protein I
LEEIENAGDFIGRLEKIELPNQLIAALEDPLLRKFLQLKGSEAVLSRLDNWLLAFFEDQLQTPDYSQDLTLTILTSIRDYTRSTKV